MNAAGTIGQLVLDAAYTGAFGLACAAGRGAGRRYRTGWIIFVVIVATLLVVRLFNLDYHAARGLQHRLGPNGWRGHRPDVALAAAFGAVVGLPAAAALLFAARRRIDPRLLAPGAGAFLLIGFVCIRALEFPPVTRAFQHHYLGLRLATVLELGLIAVLSGSIAVVLLRGTWRDAHRPAGRELAPAFLPRSHSGAGTRVGFLAVACVIVAAVPVLLFHREDASGALPFRQAVGTLSRDGTANQPSLSQLPNPPLHWPTTIQLGVSDGLGSASSTASIAPFGYRYQYLAGGVNTGSGWATWNPDGTFVTSYIRESVASGMTPVFTYYMIRQSKPGVDQSESEGVINNLRSAATMRAYYADLRLFFERAGAETGTYPVLHMEPDLWGFIEQKSSGNDAATVQVAVKASGDPELGDLPDNAAGLAQAIVRLRDRYAPNVLLGYHMSAWGTGEDPVVTKPGDGHIDDLAGRAAAFLASLQAHFDVTFAEFSDRDAAFKQAIYGDGGASWWDASDFTRNIRFLTGFVRQSGLRVVLWQIPLGNTRMRAMNNTWDHYQDNKVEVLLDDPGLSHLVDYANAGVIALLFGRGADGATCACDAAGDGVTNPAAINGNARESLNADDDGGFFGDRAAAYYANGPLPIPGVPGGPSQLARTAGSGAPVASRSQPPTASWTSAVSVSTMPVPAGQGITLTAHVTASAQATALVDIEVYNAANTRVFQQAFDRSVFAANSGQDFVAEWLPAGKLDPGAYSVKVGVFAPGWGTLLAWNGDAASFRVN